MGAGKSTVGEEVARRLGRPFVDLDRELETETASSIPELFEARGEPVFRELEEELVVEVLADGVPSVVAEAAVAWELARAAREKFGGDAIGDFVAAWRAYLERISWPAVPAK